MLYLTIIFLDEGTFLTTDDFELARTLIEGNLLETTLQYKNLQLKVFNFRTSHIAG